MSRPRLRNGPAGRRGVIDPDDLGGNNNLGQELSSQCILPRPNEEDRKSVV